MFLGGGGGGGGGAAYLNQELIEPAKPVREHVTTIDSEIQTWRSDANFRNYQIWLIVVCACSVYMWGCKQILQSMIANGAFEERLL